MRRDYSHQIGQRIVIRTKEMIHHVDVSDITHISCDNALVITYTPSTSISVNKQLKEFEKELSDFGFIRINRSTIINQAYIKSYSNGTAKSLELTNGEVFPVSRRRAYQLR